jgi:hypothetical protein
MALFAPLTSTASNWLILAGKGASLLFLHTWGPFFYHPSTSLRDRWGTTFVPGPTFRDLTPAKWCSYRPAISRQDYYRASDKMAVIEAWRRTESSWLFPGCYEADISCPPPFHPPISGLLRGGRDVRNWNQRRWSEMQREKNSSKNCGSKDGFKNPQIHLLLDIEGTAFYESCFFYFRGRIFVDFLLFRVFSSIVLGRINNSITPKNLKNHQIK